MNDDIWAARGPSALDLPRVRQDGRAVEYNKARKARRKYTPAENRERSNRAAPSVTRKATI